MAGPESNRIRSAIVAVADACIGEARDLAHFARQYLVPTLDRLPVQWSGEGSPWVQKPNLRQGYINLLFVQLYHLWEQQLGALLGSKSAHRKFDYSSSEICAHVHDAAGIDITLLDAWEAIEELKLIANTAKHSDARDSQILKARRPEFFTDSGMGLLGELRLAGPCVKSMLGFHFHPDLSAYGRAVDSVAAFWTELAAVASGQRKPRTVKAILASRRAEILDAASRHGASNVRLFGSVARGEAGPGSDIDLLVDFAPGTSIREEQRLVDELEALLGRKVDLGTPESLKPRARERILREAVPL